MSNKQLRRRNFLKAAGLGVAGGMLAGHPARAGAPDGHMHRTQRSGRTIVHPEDTGEPLVNPQMGWTFHYYSNIPTNYGSRLAPSNTLDYFPGLSVIYLRVPWSYLEPEEGKFNWGLLDTPAQRWVNQGKRIALRLTCSESWTRFGTPEWVKEAGAKGYNFKPGEGATEDGPFWEPDYGDPVFLEKLDSFLAAAAARYDGNPNVDFVDIGTYGVWGEGHTWASTRQEYPTEVKKKHIDLHCKHFDKTLLAISDDFAGPEKPGRHFEIIDYARKKGVTLRDDSILVQGGENAYFHEEMAQPFWPDRPVILECQHYGPSKSEGHWDPDIYVQAVEDYHASYASIHWWPRPFYEENREMIDRINMRLGYRLQLRTASWPQQMQAGTRFWFRASWRNAGVAPCYPGGYPALTLKDEKGGITGVFVDESFDVRSLPVGPPGEAPTKQEETTFQAGIPGDGKRGAPYLSPGTYDVFISVGTRMGTPRIALPLPNGDGQHRYRLGKVRVTG